MVLDPVEIGFYRQRLAEGRTVVHSVCSYVGASLELVAKR